ncbi:hypothetical protein Cni_G11520 [Canna indica]|uniref:AP2/ERF domain-containing protein n=1 Tax=Canna indica TaxID=4628 RepID=A0AAQ3KBY8_9LILI|nr:hypothetical protein Cni_G11520 [Canna indica]
MGKGKAKSILHSPDSSNSNPLLHIPSSSSCPSMGKRQYKGVRRRSWGSWVSEIRAPHQKTRIWLGSYSTPEAAARAYDAALLCLKGSSASFNFPASLPTQLPATVMSPKSIQRVAAAAAAATSSETTQSPSPLPPSLDTTEESTMTSSTASPSGGELDNESWVELGAFHSLLCMDHFVSPLVSSWQECEEIGDINLWSFLSE